MIRQILNRGVLVAVVVMLIVIFGLVSLFRVPVQLSPDIEPTTISINTQWPGATPQDIEKEIIIEQEKYLKSISDLEEMTSTATTGRAEIVLEFSVGTNLDKALILVNNALSQVPTYPENVDQPSISTTSASDQPIAWFGVRPLPGNPKNVDIQAMQDWLEDNAQTEFERINGVAQSQVLGGTPRQLRIYVDPAEMVERDISLNQLRTALRLRNRDISGGDFDEGKRRYLIRTIGRFRSVQEVENTVIARRDGSPIYLRDIGYVRLEKAEARARVRMDGELAVAMNVRRATGTNIIEVMDRVQETVQRLNDTILQEQGIYLAQVSDDTIYIRQAVDLVRQNLILGGCLAALMLLLFLRSFTATAIGAMAIPICTIGSFLGLSLAGRTVNVISLAGVAFAIGMMLDNSIVALENIYRHRTLGKSPMKAAHDGIREVWGAILASTTTTIFVFLPIIFVEEEAGQLFTDIAIAISAAILCSMLVGITVIPTASVRLLRKVGEEPRTAFGRNLHNLFGLAGIGVLFSNATMGTLRWLMHGVLRRITLVLGMAALSIGIAYWLLPPTEYLPEGNRNLLFAIMAPPPGYNVDEMTRIGKQLEEEYLPYVGADPADYDAGKIDVPPIDKFFFITFSGNVFVITSTVRPEDLDKFMEIVIPRLNQVPGMIGFAFRRPIFGDLGGSRGIDLDIKGDSLESIYQTRLNAFFRILEVMPGARPRPDPSTVVLGQPIIEIHPDWARAAEMGIDTQELGYLIWALTDGAFVDEFFLVDDKIDMFLYSTEGTVEHTQDVADLLLHTADGGTVPVSSIADVVSSATTETIRRVDRKRTVTLIVTPPIEIALEDAVNILEEDIIGAMNQEGQIPDGVTIEIGGASDKLKATRDALGGNFLLAIVIAYLLMVALFSHWGYPLIIMCSVPLGIVGGIFGLHLMNHGGDYLGFLGLSNINQPLDVITMLGFVILVGTVVNNPILIVEQSLHNMRDQGMHYLEAVLESTRTRIRPIMMTTMTTTFGLGPLVFHPGAGSELYRGLGTVILFGLFFSAIFTLTFIPSLLSLFLQFRELFISKVDHYREEHSGDEHPVPGSEEPEPTPEPALVDTRSTDRRLSGPQTQS